MDLKARGIRVNVLSPGTIDTADPRRRAQGRRRRFVDAHPPGTMGRPEEIATAALFLASSDSSFVTGSELFVQTGASPRQI